MVLKRTNHCQYAGLLTKPRTYVCQGVKMFFPDVGHGAFNILPGYFLEYVIYAVSGLPLSAVVSPAIFEHI